MACDGSGAGGALATLKAADGWRFVAAMTKPTGVEEVLSLRGLTKARGRRYPARHARERHGGGDRRRRRRELPSNSRIGENVAAQTPPPFKLIAFVENLGLGPVAPRHMSPASCIAELHRATGRRRETTPPRSRGRTRQVVGGALKQPWFESGEPVERLLASDPRRQGARQGGVDVYLPQRREFWARACALTAFALNWSRETYGALARSLALVGREIAAGAPLETIPLMRQIAEMTVGAFRAAPVNGAKPGARAD